MQTVTTIGLDIAKSVFQVHGVDAAGHLLHDFWFYHNSVRLAREAAKSEDKTRR